MRIFYTRYIFVLFLCSICANQLRAQITEGRIKYVSKMYFDEVEYRKIIDKGIQEEGANEEEAKKIRVSYERALPLLQEAVESEGSGEIEYFFKDSLAVEGKDFKDKKDNFIIYNLNSLSYKHFFNHLSGHPAMNTYNVDFRTDTYWNISYSIKVDTNDRKNILGFDCFKIYVEQIKEEKKGKSKEGGIFELYVTTSIAFPNYILAGMRDKITPFCALEIKMRPMGVLSMAYTQMTAIEFKQVDVTDKIKIPIQFQNVKN